MGVDGLEKRGAPWIHVSNPVFGYGPEFPGPGFVGLSKTWEAAVDDCIATITPLAKGNGGHIHGAKNAFLEPFLHYVENEQFSKTGSGQTQEKLREERRFAQASR